jgi:hypothetical protein
MPLADAFAGMRHFSIVTIYCEIPRRLIDRFYEPRRALWRSLGERPRRSPGLGEPRVQPFGVPPVAAFPDRDADVVRGVAGTTGRDATASTLATELPATP